MYTTYTFAANTEMGHVEKYDISLYGAVKTPVFPVSGCLQNKQLHYRNSGTVICKRYFHIKFYSIPCDTIGSSCLAEQPIPAKAWMQLLASQ